MLIQKFKHVFRNETDGEKPDAGGGTNESVGSGNDSRLKLLADINDKNDVERADQFAYVNDDDTTEPFEAPQITDSDAETEVKEPDTDTTPPSQPQKVTLKINGVEKEVTLDEALALAQKVAAADEYLEEARAARKAAKDTEADKPTAEELARAQVDEDLKLIRAIKTGSDEEAVAALRKVRGPVNMDEIGRTIDERLAFDRALEWFNAEYTDLVSDAQLHQIVLQKDEELVRSGDKRPYKERYKAIGDDVRQWRDDIIKKHTPATTPADTTLQDKERAKREAPKTPAAAAAKAAPPRDDGDKEESPAEIIANMAKVRGGPQWMRS